MIIPARLFVLSSTSHTERKSGSLIINTRSIGRESFLGTEDAWNEAMLRDSCSRIRATRIIDNRGATVRTCYRHVRIGLLLQFFLFFLQITFIPASGLFTRFIFISPFVQFAHSIHSSAPVGRTSSNTNRGLYLDEGEDFTAPDFWIDEKASVGPILGHTEDQCRQ